MAAANGTGRIFAVDSLQQIVIEGHRGRAKAEAGRPYRRREATGAEQNGEQQKRGAYHEPDVSVVSCPVSVPSHSAVVGFCATAAMASAVPQAADT